MRLVALAAALLAACAGSDRHVLARGTLAYGVAAAGPLVASVELDTRFRLVLRAAGAAHTVDLGPPDFDFVALATDGKGSLVAVAGLDGTVRTFATEGTPRASWRLDAAATAVALTADGAYLAHGAASGVLCLRRAGDGALLQCVAAHDARVSGLAFDGSALVSAGADGKVFVWDVPSLRLRAHHDAGAPVLHVAAGGGRVAVATAQTIEVWRPADDTVERRTPSAVTAMTFLPDGQLRTSVDPSVHALAAAPDGRTLYVAAWTGTDLAGASLTAIPLP